MEYDKALLDDLRALVPLIDDAWFADLSPAKQRSGEFTGLGERWHTADEIRDDILKRGFQDSLGGQAIVHLACLSRELPHLFCAYVAAVHDKLLLPPHIVLSRTHAPVQEPAPHFDDWIYPECFCDYDGHDSSYNDADARLPIGGVTASEPKLRWNPPAVQPHDEYSASCVRLQRAVHEALWITVHDYNDQLAHNTAVAPARAGFRRVAARHARRPPLPTRTGGAAETRGRGAGRAAALASRAVGDPARRSHGGAIGAAAAGAVDPGRAGDAAAARLQGRRAAGHRGHLRADALARCHAVPGSRPIRPDAARERLLGGAASHRRGCQAAGSAHGRRASADSAAGRHGSSGRGGSRGRLPQPAQQGRRGCGRRPNAPDQLLAGRAQNDEHAVWGAERDSLRARAGARAAVCSCAPKRTGGGAVGAVGADCRQIENVRPGAARVRGGRKPRRPAAGADGRQAVSASGGLHGRILSAHATGRRAALRGDANDRAGDLLYRPVRRARARRRGPAGLRWSSSA